MFTCSSFLMIWSSRFYNKMETCYYIYYYNILLPGEIEIQEVSHSLIQHIEQCRLVKNTNLKSFVLKYFFNSNWLRCIRKPSLIYDAKAAITYDFSISVWDLNRLVWSRTRCSYYCGYLTAASISWLYKCTETQ